MGEGVQQVVAPLTLTFSEDHEVFRGLIEAISSNGPAVVQLRLSALLGSIDLLANLAQLVVDLLVHLVELVSLPIDLLLLIANVDQL